MAELTFTYGTMAAGKSTLALQLCWQLRQSRSDVALWTFGDRSADGMVTSRIGIEAEAEAVTPGADLAAQVEDLLGRGVNAQVITDLNQPWGESDTCTGCGKCINVCPTGALVEKGKSVREMTKQRQFLPYLTLMRERRW